MWVLLYIFLGEKLFSMNLGYRPGKLCIDTEHIFILDAYHKALHVYTWECDLVKTFDRGYLDIEKDDIIWEVCGNFIMQVEKFTPHNEYCFYAYSLPI